MNRFTSWQKRELEILRPLLLFVQLKAVPPIFNFLKGQGQGSDFFFAKTNHPELGQVLLIMSSV